MDLSLGKQLPYTDGRAAVRVETTFDGLSPLEVRYVVGSAAMQTSLLSTSQVAALVTTRSAESRPDLVEVCRVQVSGFRI